MRATLTASSDAAMSQELQACGELGGAAAAGSPRGTPLAGSRRSSRGGRGRSWSRSRRSTCSSSGSVAGTSQHRIPAAFAVAARDVAAPARRASAARQRSRRPAHVSAPAAAAPARAGCARRAGPACPPRGTCRQRVPAAPAPRRAARAGRTTAIQPSFSCGRPQDFDRPPSENVSARCRRRPGSPARGIGAPREVGEHLVGDDRHVAGRAQLLQVARLVLLQERSGGVVGVHHHDGARALGHLRRQAAGAQVPLAVVGKRVGPMHHVFEAGEKVEERIARARHQHLVAGIAQCLEQERVRLAAARGEQDLAGIDRRAAPQVVARDGSARREQAARIGLVAQRGWSGKERQDRIIRREARPRSGSIRSGR